MWYISIACSAILFSRCDNPVQPDQVPHPEASQDTSTQFNRAADDRGGEAAGTHNHPEQAGTVAEDSNIH